MKDTQQIKIFDTTLRDGQQCPGAGMTFEENLAYAKLALKLRIDVLEAGFPSASRTDFAIVNTIARDIAPIEGAPIIAALCQLREEQIARTIEALLPAVPFRRARMHVYLPVDPALMRASLGERADKKGELVDDLARFTAMAIAAGLEVEFSPEGYSRQGSNFDFVSDLIRAAVSAGATVINCPDTIGGASRFQGPEYFVALMKRHAALITREFPDRDVTWSVHCHNDFGLALENSLEGVFNGPARQIEGCFNGIGERAGNVSLEQCIMVIKHFAGRGNVESPLYTNVDTAFIQEISDFVAERMLPRQPHWPITGGNAFKHSAGGHTNAILHDAHAYQAFDPAEVGGEISLLFGPLSGGNHAQSIIRRSGYRCEESEKSAIAQFVKDLYHDRRKGITDDELLHGYFEFRKPIAIESYDYARSRDRSEITLSGRFFDQQGTIHDSYQGKDSALATLQNAIDRKMPGWNIANYHSESVGSGISAASRSTIIIRNAQERRFTGVGEDNDIEVSAMKALIDAINKAYIDLHYKVEAAL